MRSDEVEAMQDAAERCEEAWRLLQGLADATGLEAVRCLPECVTSEGFALVAVRQRVRAVLGLLPIRQRRPPVPSPDGLREGRVLDRCRELVQYVGEVRKRGMQVWGPMDNERFLARFMGRVRGQLRAVTAERDALKAQLDAAWEATRVPVRGWVSLAEVVEESRTARERLTRVVGAIPEPLSAGDWQVVEGALKAREAGLLHVHQVDEANRLAASREVLSAKLFRLSVCEIVRQHEGVEDAPQQSMDELRRRLDVVRERIRAYDGGDRPPSPPASLLREEVELLRLLGEGANC